MATPIKRLDLTAVPSVKRLDLTTVPKQPKKLTLAEKLKVRQAEVAANLGEPISKQENIGRGVLDPREIGTSLKGGVGDTISNLGASMRYVGGKAGLEQPGSTLTEDEKKVMLAQSFLTKVSTETVAAGEKLQAYGQKVSEKNYLEPVAWEGWRTLLNPKFYQRNVARTVPTSASIMGPALLTGGITAGLGTIGGAVTAGVLNRAMESAMEAGGTYEEALAKGVSKQEADKAADSTFRNNMKLVGLDIGEFAAAFLPGVKAASKLGKAAVAAGRLAVAGGQEALEEALQEKYQREALGEPFSWKDPRTQEAAAIGGLMGIGLGGAGEVSRLATDIHKAAAAKLPDAQRLALNVEVASRMAEGKTWAVGAREAMDTLAKQNPAINAAVRDATQEVRARYAEAAPQQTFAEQAAAAPVAKAAPAASEIAPTPLPQTQAPPQIAAPSASQRATATEQGRFVGAGKVALGESTVEAMTTPASRAEVQFYTHEQLPKFVPANELFVEFVRSEPSQFLSVVRNIGRALQANEKYTQISFRPTGKVLDFVERLNATPDAKRPGVFTISREALLTRLRVPAESYPDLAAKAKAPLSQQEGAVLETFKQVLPQAKEVSEDLIRQEIAYLKATMGKGVVQGGPVRTDSGEVVGHYPTISQNDRWYQEWYAAHKRKPNQKELREIAVKRLERGGPVNAHEVGPNQEFVEAQKVIETVETLEGKAKPATIQDITSELRAKQQAQESLPETEWTGRTPDVLKQTVQRIEAEQGALPKAVKAKYGEEGFVERQVTGVANLFAEMRAKDAVKVSDAEVEKVLTATKSAQTVKAQIVNWFRNAGAAFKDVFSFEWRLAEYPRFQDQVRRFQGAQRDAQISALETYLAVVSPMEDKALGPARMKLFSRLIDLRDMLEDLRAGKKIAGDLSEAQLVEAEAELMAKADQTVKQSLQNHDAIMKAAWQELQRRQKVDPDTEGREHYYPHKILDYMREIDAKYPGLGAKLKAPYRYYLQKRGGTTRLFDTDYLTVTMNHLTKLYLDNATDDFALEVARDYDAWPDMSEAERQRYGGSPEAGRLYEIGDERYFGWSYDAFHRTKNPILTEITDPMLVQADLEARKQMQKFLSQVHVIPEEIANRIAQLKAPAVKAHTLNAIRTMQWFWKNIVLGPFGAGIPFQFNNFVGDTINLFREDPAAVLFIPQGWRAAKEWQKGQVSEKFQHLMDVAEQTRVVEAGMMRAGGLPYDPILRTLEPMRYALKSLNPFEAYRKMSERRELSGRLAKLMADLERIGKGEMVVAKMIDVKKLQEGGMSPVEVAGKIAREYTVDYGKLTPEGKMIVRDLAFPFSTFYVHNFQNWVTYIQKNPGEMTLKFLVPLAALAAYNALRFPEEEDKLPVYYRVMPHLITGYKTPDGKPIIISFQTPLDMAAKMVGLEIVGDLARQVATDEKSIGDATKELAMHMATAPLRTMRDLANVFFKAPIEALMNENTFTGAPIVSEDIKDTAEGIRQRLNYILQQWFSPYGQYVRAARDIEPEKALGKWLFKGPADIKRAVGIREVDLEKEQVSRFYDELDRLEGAYAVWKDKREEGRDVGAFADLVKLRRLRAVASDFTDQWKIIDRIKQDKSRTQDERDKEVRSRYVSMARRIESVMQVRK